MPDRTVEHKWWISNGDKPDGPFEIEIIRGRIKALDLFPDNLACPVGGDEWRPLRDWKEAFADAISVAVSLLPPPPPINFTNDRVQAGSVPEEMTFRPSEEKGPILEKTQGKSITSSESPPNIGSGAGSAFKPDPQGNLDLKEHMQPGWILYLMILVPFLLPSFGSTPGSPWLLAIVATIFGGIVFSVLIQPQENGFGAGIVAFIFTFIIAIPLLFFF